MALENLSEQGSISDLVLVSRQRSDVVMVMAMGAVVICYHIVMGSEPRKRFRGGGGKRQAGAFVERASLRPNVRLFLAAVLDKHETRITAS